jgi:hypothetical protein
MSHPWLIPALAATLLAGLLIAAGALLAGPGAAKNPKPAVGQPFDLSQTLPTGTGYSNAQVGCGPNVTVVYSFPTNGLVTYNMAQNQTGATVNIWASSASVDFFDGTGSGHIAGTFSSGKYTFVFQACGPSASVSLGFWGTTN